MLGCYIIDLINSHSNFPIKKLYFLQPPHWTKMGLWITFWWTSQNLIFMILGHIFDWEKYP